MDFFKKTVDAQFVDAFGGLQHVEVHADFRREMNESLHVFRETETSIAEARIEELSANARIQSHGMCDFLDVRADLFTKVGDHVGITDFQSQEGVRSVLDQLGAANGGDEKFRLLTRRARSVVDGTLETPLQNRAIDLTEFCRRGRIFYSDHNPVRVEKISDGSAFAEEFRVGSDTEFQVAVPGISGKGAAEFKPRARGHGAFLHNKFRRARFCGDLPGNVINRRKVSLAGILRRGSDANENGITRPDGLAGIGSIGNPSSFASGHENLVEVLFVDGDASGVELGDALAVNVRANHFVARFGETGSRDQPYVSTTND